MSLGRELKALREKNGLTIEELSEQTHIGTHILEDLEAGDFGRIRAAIYGSGFVKILAKHYGIDGTQLRETFATEYQAWVVANAKTPAPKKAPLKFTDRRFGAKPADAAPAQRPADAAPVQRPGDATPVLRPGGNAGEKPAPAPAPAPAPTPRHAPTPAPATSNQMAAPSGPPPTAAGATPDPLDNPAEEPLGGLFAGIEEAATASAPAQRPGDAAPVQRPGDAAPVQRPGGNAGDVKPAPAPAPAHAPAPRKQRPPRKPRKPPIDKAALLASARTSIRSLCASVTGVVRTPLFQRIGVAALAIALSAWLCSLFIGGGTAAPEEPEVAEAPRTEVAAPAAPVLLPEEAAPAAPVLLPGGNAGAVGAEAPLSDSAARRQPVHSFTGSALTDNLLPPPDCYAD